MKTALVVIFNHRYDKNIDKLRQIYKHRFSMIRYLVPFYDGQDEEVIPVYESSYQFQGFLIQAYEKLADLGADFYYFVADDLILAPWINENNIVDYLDMVNKDVFIYEVNNINRDGGYAWKHSRQVYRAFEDKQAVNYEQEIPTFDDAMSKFESFLNEKVLDKYEKNYFGKGLKLKEKIRFYYNNKGTKIPYPLAHGYSDTFMIGRNVLYPISRLCGIFSAMNMFVEIAFPTAVVLTVDRSKVTCMDDIQEKVSSNIMWSFEEIESLHEKHGGNLSSLFESWDAKCFCIHPIKLSKWTI